MRRTAALIAALLALAASGCGSGNDAEEGGTMHGASLAFPDYLDPGLSYTLEGWNAMQNAYTPLLTYEHASGTVGTKLIPGLAKSQIGELQQDAERRDQRDRDR